MPGFVKHRPCIANPNNKHMESGMKSDRELQKQFFAIYMSDAQMELQPE